MGVCADSPDGSAIRLSPRMGHRKQLPGPWHTLELMLAAAGEGEAGAGHEVVNGP